ncbi:hypothetical protein IJH15_03400 [Candidatus Saccharibacteria bacterium]|nr:hypothetical protein [Candidatus Saccharibacteria bacterium]MBR3253348.1 hypothetical protein [Candidatus Saccharibacteria bacterium]
MKESFENSNEDVNRQELTSEQTFQTWEEHQKELAEAGLIEGDATSVNEEKASEEPVDLEKLRLDMKELATNGATGESGKEAVELVKFGVMEIPKEIVGEDRVLVDSLKERSKFDLVGRAKDKKAADKIMFDEDSMEDEEFRELFTPTVASLCLKEMHDNQNMFRQMDGRVFEALPLDVQLKELSNPEMIQLIMGGRSFMSDSFVNKVACGVINNLATEQDESKRVSGEAFAHMIGWNARSRSSFGGYPLSECLDERVSGKLSEIAEGFGISKYDTALALQSDEAIIDHLDSLLDPRTTTVKEVYDIRFIIESAEEKGKDVEGWREKYEAAFAPELRRLVEIGSLKYKKMTVEDASSVLDEMDATRERREVLGLTEGQWDHIRTVNPVIYEQLNTATELDEATIADVETYANSGLMDTSKDEIKSLEDIKNVDKVLLATAKELLTEYNDPDGAREYLGHYAFGMGVTEIADTLVSLGIAEIRRPRTASTTGNFIFGVDHFKVKDMSALGELSREEKLLVLEAIALLGCKNEKLEEKIGGYEEHSVPSDEKKRFVDIIEGAKERRQRAISETYSGYMQESLKKGLRLVEEQQFEGKEIPVYEMEGEEFMLLIHRLGAYAGKDKSDPAQWNSDEKLKETAKSIGYISTAAIADGALRLANIHLSELGSQDEVFYSFSKLGDKSIETMCETDAYTRVEEFRRGYDTKKSIMTERQGFFYDDPRKLIARSKRATKEDRETRQYCEVVLDRYSGNPDEHGGRLQPSEIVAFVDDPSKIGDLQRKHAAYFGIPIVMIDPNRYK